MELWNGPVESAPAKRNSSMHTNSQSDYFNNIGEGAGFPPAPVVTTKTPAPPVQNTPKQDEMFDMGGPQAANGVLGGSFGSFF